MNFEMRNDDGMSQSLPRAISMPLAKLGLLRKLAASVVVLVMVVVAALAAVGPAHAQFGLTDGPAAALPDSSSWWAGTCDLTAPDETAFGGPGDTPATPWSCIDDGSFLPASAVVAALPAWRLSPSMAAGGHPDATARFTVRPLGQSGDDALYPDGGLRDAIVDLPPGVVGNVRAMPQCSQADFSASPPQCHPSTQVGLFRFRANDGGTVLPKFFHHPIYNLEARPGMTAELGVAQAGLHAPIRIFAKARTDGDFAVVTGAKSLPTVTPVVQNQVQLWGVPWAASHDRFRVPQGWHPALLGFFNDRGFLLPGGLNCGLDGHGNEACPTPYQPSWGPIRPFFTNPTECSGQALNTRLTIDSYEDPAAFLPGNLLTSDPNLSDPNWLTYDSTAPPIEGCREVPFAPDMTISPTSNAADAASGLSVDFQIPQNDDPPAAITSNPDDETGAPAHWKSSAGRATAHLDRAVVTLPDGVSVNPSSAAGLTGCSDADIGVTDPVSNPKRFDNVDPLNGDASDGGECPNGSVIGTVSVISPLLAEPVAGQVVLGQPLSTDPQSGEMFRLFLVLRNTERDLIAKIYGSTVADPATGRLTATFDKNPRLPFESMQLEFKGGERGLLALPQRCGAGRDWGATFTPWTAAHGAGGVPTGDGGSFNIDNRCGNGFAPTLDAGMNTREARVNGSFSFRFGRSDGEQYLRGLTTRLPQGLLASVRGVPLCSDAQASAGACPSASKIGVVDAKAGSGDPFVLEEKGEVFLTKGYKGGEYGLMVKVRPIAGPFRGAMELSPIIVRQALHVDRTTAQVTAISDPFPLIHHGVPLRVREVTVLINRDGFMLNPSGCEPKQIAADISSDQGTVSSAVDGFQASRCANLAFRPKLALRLTGKRQVRTGRHPGIRAVVTQQGIPEAGIEKAEVRLPKSLALDVENAQALCEFDQGTRPDLEKHCPKGSIVGRARAVSPLLNDPLVGNVYFVKNVRRSASGNLIRTLPMIIVALRGEIAVNLRGESNVKKGKLVNTFDKVPDAPITRFNLNIRGGKNGILAVTRTRKALIDLCTSGRQTAEADIDGHNGRRHDLSIAMRKPCRRKSAVKRAKAKRAHPVSRHDTRSARQG